MLTSLVCIILTFFNLYCSVSALQTITILDWVPLIPFAFLTRLRDLSKLFTCCGGTFPGLRYSSTSTKGLESEVCTCSKKLEQRQGGQKKNNNNINFTSDLAPVVGGGHIQICVLLGVIDAHK